MNISVTQNVQKFLDCINKSGPLVGFDLGTKTIGVAISDESRTIASPVVVIKRKKFFPICSMTSDFDPGNPTIPTEF